MTFACKTEGKSRSCSGHHTFHQTRLNSLQLFHFWGVPLANPTTTNPLTVAGYFFSIPIYGSSLIWTISNSVALLRLSGQSSCLCLMPATDTSVRAGWTGNSHTQLQATLHQSGTSSSSAVCLCRFHIRFEKKKEILKYECNPGWSASKTQAEHIFIFNYLTFTQDHPALPFTVRFYAIPFPSRFQTFPLSSGV